MMHAKSVLRRIEVNYAGVQSGYWMAMCALTSYLAVYLGYRGLSNTQIGLTAALIAGFNISLQLFFSNYSDAHLQVPIKRIIAALFIVAIVLVTLILSLPLGVGMLMLVYALAGGLGNTVNGLLNAQIMQYINVGIPVQYGWPRGFGSIVYALFALFLGNMLEQYSPALLMPVFLVCAVFAIGLTLLMPEVYTLSDRRAAIFVHEKGHQHSTYRSLLRRSPVFMVFLSAGILLYVGQAGSMLFLVRVVESAGGGNAQLGIVLFIQGGIEMPVMFLAPLILKRFKARDVLVFSLVFYLIKAILLAVAGSMTVIYIAMGMSIFCFGLYGISSVYFVDSLVLPGEKVRAQGLTSLCSSFGGIIASMLSGLIIDNWGLKPLLTVSCVSIAAALLLMALCRRLHIVESTLTERASP